MSEELNRHEAELSDAELGNVSGGMSVDVVQKVCSSCYSRKQPERYACTYGGGDPTRLLLLMENKLVITGKDKFNQNLCPYLTHS